MKQTLKINDKIISTTQPMVMGIINCTPDSFYSNSRKQLESDILEEAQKQVSDGVFCIDLGGFSTRPGVQFVTIEEEWKRLQIPLSILKSTFPNLPLSIDTFRSEIAEKALKNGADLINDISAGSFDKRILDVVATFQCPYIAMHLEGSLQTIHKSHQKENITQTVIRYFETKIAHFSQKGIEQIILDPGFGFSKTMDDNFSLLNHLEQLKDAFDVPILAGLSRKTMIWQTLHSSPENALNGTSVLNTIALMKGATILRVHDVKEAKEAIQLTQQFTPKKK